MPTQLISAGPSFPMLQNIVYALPARASIIASDAAVEVAQSLTGPWVAYTVGNFVASGFVRCPSANTTIIIKN